MRCAVFGVSLDAGMFKRGTRAWLGRGGGGAWDGVCGTARLRGRSGARRVPARLGGPGGLGREAQVRPDGGMVDAFDLKSNFRKEVPVRIRLRVPGVSNSMTSGDLQSRRRRKAGLTY